MNNYYEVKEGRIYKTEFQPFYFGGYRTWSAGLETLQGKEWQKEMDQDALDSFFACHPAD